MELGDQMGESLKYIREKRELQLEEMRVMRREALKMGMAKELWVYGIIVIAGFALRCNATTFIVGDNSGWDISTDLDSWSQGKSFSVGDVLVFQYSSSDSLNEVTKENFESCNTADVIKTYSSGNTTVTLSKPGDHFFVSGNRLYCLGGMKLHVHVSSNQAYSPAASPESQPNDLPHPSSKSDNNPSASPGFVIRAREAFVLVFLGFVSSLV